MVTKNRTGTAMEHLVGEFLKDVCEKNNYPFSNQANAKSIEIELGNQSQS